MFLCRRGVITKQKSIDEIPHLESKFKSRLFELSLDPDNKKSEEYVSEAKTSLKLFEKILKKFIGGERVLTI